MVKISQARLAELRVLSRVGWGGGGGAESGEQKGLWEELGLQPINSDELTRRRPGGRGVLIACATPAKKHRAKKAVGWGGGGDEQPPLRRVQTH